MQRLGALATVLVLFSACASADGNGDGDGDGADASISTTDASPPIDAAPNEADAAPANTLTLIVPNGGEVFQTSTTEQIIWTTPGGIVGDIDIELWKADVKHSDIALGEANDGVFDWNIASSLATGTDYRIRIFATADPSVTDESNADFAIDGRSLSVTAPNGAEMFTAGTTTTIMWTSVGVISTVDVKLHKGGAFARDVAVGVSNNGSFVWDVPTDLADADDYTIVVTDTASPATDVSDSSFSVANWQFHMPITMTSAVTLTDFQVIIDINAANFTYANAAADGADIRFASDAVRSNGFDRTHFTQTWAPGGSSRIWINIPLLPAGTPVIVHMFYGLDGQSDTSDFNTTFPNRFDSTGTHTLNGSITVDAYTVSAGHTVNVQAGVAGVINARLIRIDGTVNGVGRGFGGGSGGGAGLGTAGGGGGATTRGGGGGGHGGSGGAGGRDSGDAVAAGGSANGSATSQSVSFGSGGGSADSAAGGAGGGAITFSAASVVIDGTVNVSGASGVGGTGRNGGGGAGGTIMVLAWDVTLTGNLIATGGNGGIGLEAINDDGGGGGGGRVKLFTEIVGLDTASKNVNGGAPGPNGSIPGGSGGSGSVASPAYAAGEPSAVLGTQQPVF